MVAANATIEFFFSVDSYVGVVRRMQNNHKIPEFDDHTRNSPCLPSHMQHVGADSVCAGTTFIKGHGTERNSKYVGTIGQ